MSASPSPSPTDAPPLDAVLSELRRLRRYDGPPARFWPELVEVLSRLAGAQRGMIVRRDPKEPERLLQIGAWAAEGHADRVVPAFLRGLPELTNLCLQEGRGMLPLEAGTGGGERSFACGVALQFQDPAESCVAVFLCLNATQADLAQRLVRLELASDVPLAFLGTQTAARARKDVEKFASVLDVTVPVNAETRFRAASLALCNALAGSFACERVSLGWQVSGQVRLQAISRTERFDRRREAAQAIEVVMEECLDQDEEILWPAPDGAGFVTRDHEQYGRAKNPGHLLSLPVRVGKEVVGALTCERLARPFDELEVQQLRLVSDTVARRMGDLQRRDRWFGSRWAAAFRERAARWLGPERTWSKVGAVAGTLALIALVLPVYPYRVEGEFILRSDELVYLSAPFDGFIESVAVRPGDTLAAGAPLLSLNTDQLQLDEAAAVADQTRYRREAEKARAKDSPADMRIAMALADQATARLDLVRFRLRQARLASPFEGVVVEGDLRQRLGAPVHQGDALFKIARLDALYVEVDVEERDVHEILGKTAGQIAFLAQPRRKFPVRITKVEPAAMPKERANVFLVRGALEGDREPWWRPGMSGICKIDVERRTLAWILGHRTVDFLRLYLWW